MRIDGHIINLDRMTEGGWVLDAGCRHFTLSKNLKDRFKYICLDPDPIITPPKNVIFRPYALMTENGTGKYCGWSTGEGNYLYKDQPPHYATLDIQVTCRTIKSVMEQFQIKQFELAKLDIEGAEYDILLGIDTPFAKQIAVEFHQSLGHNPHGTHDEYIQKLKGSPFGTLYKETEHYESHPGIYEYNFIIYQ